MAMSPTKPKRQQRKQQEQEEQQWPIGTLICKKFEPYPPDFEGGWFGGKVTNFDASSGFYQISYDDGDAEDFDSKDMQTWQVIKKTGEDDCDEIHHNKPPASTPQKRLRADDNNNNKSWTQQKLKLVKMEAKDNHRHVNADDNDVGDSTKANGNSRYSRRKRATVDYQIMDNDDEDDIRIDDDEDYTKKTNGTSAHKRRSHHGDRTSKQSTKKKKQDDDNVSDVSIEESSSEEELEDVEDSSSKEELEAKPVKSKSKSAAAAATAAPITRVSMADAFKPLNNPLFWTKSLTQIQEDHEYLDPCGMEATDDVIDHLVGEQVLKVAKLLERALADPRTIGSSKTPFQLGTVCSGTDAPALALTIVQEQMERFQLPCQLHVQHQFSCEKEPFKQSYLARNFDSTLYPDVVKLTETDTPLDVYGRPKKIPAMNGLIAGTSCKNFSMLVSTRRLDIEDKGCSGETFLATVELLFQEQPLISIFENVTGAPWDKMAEYITGRVPLGTINDPKGINKNVATSKEKSIKQLMFQVQDKDQVVVVTEVPMNIGVRCGAIVKGFLMGTSREVMPAIWPKKKTFSLDELLKANKINVDVSKKSKDMLVFDTPCTFCTAVLNVDTKHFGLPQTRQRTYMFVWQPEDPANYTDDLGEYWKAMFKYLESPVKHSLESFILDDDHDNIRVFREALRGPSGRHTKRSIFQEPDFYTSGNANVKHNVTCRDMSGMDLHARPNVRSAQCGAKQIPPHYWLEYFDTMRQRELDMCDILHIAAARDAEAHDSNFGSFFWNISQNVSKEKHRMATPGIAGCISPGGEFLCPNLGRPLLGCEKLLLQGIPYFRLTLGSETEVELGDMAGNAMSLTVVCAAQIAAMLSPQLRREVRSTSADQIAAYLQNECSLPSHKKIILPNVPPSFDCTTDAHPIFGSLAKMADEAMKSSVWCTCETSGRNSESTNFMECRVCRVSVCSDCLSSHNGYQMDSHRQYCQEVQLLPSEHRTGTFLSKLRHEAPSTLVFGQDGIKAIADLTHDSCRVTDLSKLVFNLQDIKRHRMKWTIHYNARDNGGIGEVVAEFRVSVGKIWRQVNESDDSTLGLKGELLSYFPAKVKPLRRGKIEPCAVVIVNAKTPENICWTAKAQSKKVSAMLIGSEPENSYRVELGLNGKAQDSLEANSKGSQAKYFKAAKARGEAERWVYSKNWREWPKTIEVVCDDVTGVSGEYRRAACRQTTNQSALWIRRGAVENETLYLLMKPNVGRTGPDVGIISRSMDHDDHASILLHLPSLWQPCHALNPEHHENEAEAHRWDDLSSAVTCNAPTASLSVTTAAFLPHFVSIEGLTDAQVSMIYPFECNEKDEIELPIFGGSRSQKVLRAFNYICVPPMIQTIAQDYRLSADLSPSSPWKPLHPESRKPFFGYGNEIIPSRPTEAWYFDEERDVWARRSNPEESRAYFVQLQQSRKTFEFTLKRSSGQIIVRCFPEVAAHHAVRFLVEGRTIPNPEKEISVAYRVSDTAQQADPQFSPFKVYPCTNESQTEVGLKHPYTLYDRQKRVVTKMSMIESGTVPFKELEMSEHEMPGSTGISLIAQATRERSISGGVIADAIGAGKTVISIAMIVKGLVSSRKSRQYPRSTSATAVAVPSALVGQWKDEIDKFTTGLNVICIRDTNDLMKTSVAQIIEADVVIFPVDIIEPVAYTDNLVAKSSTSRNDSKIPPLPRAMSNAEKAGAKGVWIPATSRDPYGIGSANEMKNQKLRDISAYFTHSYLKSIQILREKIFKPTDKGVPLEYFEWERVIIDEIHECLCTEKDNLQLDWFKEKNRRASRELLGITQKDVHQRPLVHRKSIFGLTGTPLLDNSSRVIELANLIGCTYVIGLASHWRKLERESRRDIFLQHYLEPKQSREIRKAIYSKCQEYLDVACCRNTTEKELEGITLIQETVTRKMGEQEAKDYIKSQQGIPNKDLSVRPEQFDPSAGHDISKFLRQNANSVSRGSALVETCRSILQEHPRTKIIVFCDGRINAGEFAHRYLTDSSLGCTWLQADDSVEEQNRKISYYQRPDTTTEDEARPRVLVLHFDHAAGLNLQKESNHLILYSPLYVGDGGLTGDAVADASIEQQAIGRVFRPGQLRSKVSVYRLALEGPSGEECLDGYLIRRNTDKDTLAATTNAG